MDTQRLSMMTDLYEFIMCAGYYSSGKSDSTAYFDLFFRSVPDGGAYAVAAGLEQVCDYISSFGFDSTDIDFLRENGIGDRYFLEYLSAVRFSGDIYAVPEGTVVFPNEPILTLRAPICEAQLAETALLNIIGHQTLIATKAARMAYAANGRHLIELGARRAHGPDAAVYGARAAYIGGSSASSCTLASQRYGIPCTGTMAHSWVQAFDCEYEAFCAYLRTHPKSPTLLVDTYDTLGSGVPAACEAIRDILLPQGIRKAAIRIDSGDISRLSKKTREMLDRSGLYDCEIIVSGSLDEYKIQELCRDNAPIDAFGVGQSLITSESSPVFSGVYKLAALEQSGEITPRIKLSESIGKSSLPGVKRTLRYYGADSKAVADEVILADETLPYGKHTIFHPQMPWKSKTLNSYSVRELLVPIYIGGKRVYELPSVEQIKQYCICEKQTLRDELMRLNEPGEYFVDLSERLWELTRRMTGQRRSDFFLV